MKDKEYWLVEVAECIEDFIVRAKTKDEAKDKVYKYINESYPPEVLKKNGYKPYRKKDIYSCRKLNECFIDDVIEII